MKSVVFGTAMLALAAGAASAADTGVAQSSDWTGGYAGLFGGYAWGSADLSADITSPWPVPTSLDADSDMDGWLGGVQVGYDYEFGGGFVLGAVADWAITGLDSDAVCLEDFGTTCSPADRAEPDHAEGTASMDWLATFRARAGFAAGDALFYATGGIAVASLEVNVNDLEFEGDDYSDSETQTGWTVGAGMEYRLTENISLGAEYLYVDLGSIDTSYDVSVVDPNDTEIDAETEFTANIVKASLNYRF